jgi:hypothetical protein
MAPIDRPEFPSINPFNIAIVTNHTEPGSGTPVGEAFPFKRGMIIIDNDWGWEKGWKGLKIGVLL